MIWVLHSEPVFLHYNSSPSLLGSFGRVRLGKHKTTGKYWAVKILKKAEIIKLKQVDHIQNEVNILSAVAHPFIVTY